MYLFFPTGHPELKVQRRISAQRSQQTRQRSVRERGPGGEQQARGGEDSQRHRGGVEECPAACRGGPEVLYCDTI